MTSADSVHIRPPQLGDGETLRPILETWIRDGETGQIIGDEVDGVVAAVEIAASGDADRKYFIAENAGGKVLGMVGVTAPDEHMAVFARTDRPVELVNAYVDRTARGTGVGTALIDAVESDASASGYTEVVLNSGPRYAETAHGFYTKRYGEPVAVSRDHYGPGRHAPVWRKEL